VIVGTSVWAGRSAINLDRSISRRDTTPAMPDKNRIQKSRVFT
jgi:hypothetical protein